MKNQKNVFVKIFILDCHNIFIGWNWKFLITDIRILYMISVHLLLVWWKYIFDLIITSDAMPFWNENHFCLSNSLKKQPIMNKFIDVYSGGYALFLCACWDFSHNPYDLSRLVVFGASLYQFCSGDVIS